MFESLSGRLSNIFDQLRRKGKLSEADVDSVMREVKLALLEADVHYSVVKDFIARVRERAIGVEVARALNPAQQVIKIVNEELIRTLGESQPLELKGEKPRVIMLVGLQGSGKTTAAAKLANKLRENGERVMLVGADPYRPAAIDQLNILAEKINVPLVADKNSKPPQVVTRAYDQAKKGGYSVVIIDTAGRSQLDQQLMSELNEIEKKVHPVENLLVVDSMIGQEALPIAQGFREVLPLTGLIFTKMDGDSRGGAAISIRSVVGIPIKFIGTGESIDALEIYDPKRLASRILGMGDVIGLIEKAEATFDKQESAKQAQKLISGKFTLEDFSGQIKQIKKMGSINQIFGMLPGNLSRVADQIDPKEAESHFVRIEAIIDSMTPLERKKPELLNASRKRRIAGGSGTEVQDVNKLLKQYRDTKKMMDTLKKTGGKGLRNLFN